MADRLSDHPSITLYLTPLTRRLYPVLHLETGGIGRLNIGREPSVSRSRAPENDIPETRLTFRPIGVTIAGTCATRHRCTCLSCVPWCGRG